jgi:hypothetical protein
MGHKDDDSNDNGDIRSVTSDDDIGDDDSPAAPAS